MRYSEKELQGFSCPMNETTREQCLKIFSGLKSIVESCGYRAVGEVKIANPNSAAISCMLSRDGKKLAMGIRTSMATNTGYTAQSPVRLYLCAEDKEAALSLQEKLLTYPLIQQQGNVFCFENELRPCTFLLCYGHSWSSLEQGMQVLNTGKWLYPDLDLWAFNRKNKATEYEFCRLCRILVHVYYALESELRQDICPVKMQQLVYNLPEQDFARFDTYQDKVTYLLLELDKLVEEQGLLLYESNGRNKLLTDVDEQQRYLAFLRIMRKHLA